MDHEPRGGAKIGILFVTTDKKEINKYFTTRK